MWVVIPGFSTDVTICRFGVNHNLGGVAACGGVLNSYTDDIHGSSTYFRFAAGWIRRFAAARQMLSIVLSDISIVVVGAGIVGASTALALQADGHQVTLLDREGPGAGASFGNAGVIVNASCAPTAMPGITADALRSRPNGLF